MRRNLSDWAKDGIGNLAQRITNIRHLLLAQQLALPKDLNFLEEATLMAHLEDLHSQEEIF